MMEGLVNKKHCPLSLISNSDGPVAVCIEDYCQFWHKESKCCVMKTFFMGLSYNNDGLPSDKEVQ